MNFNYYFSNQEVENTLKNGSIRSPILSNSVFWEKALKKNQFGLFH